MYARPREVNQRRIETILMTVSTFCRGRIPSPRKAANRFPDGSWFFTSRMRLCSWRDYGRSLVHMGSAFCQVAWSYKEPRDLARFNVFVRYSATDHPGVRSDPRKPL